jgi:thiol-disulfide isomerase/thioredoxin
MKALKCFLFSIVLLSSAGLYAQNAVTTAVPSAAEVLKKAVVKAGNENKKVLLMFHASWCVWCHRMDSSLVDPSCKKFFDDNFVITHITVSESKGKENLENAGGAEMMEKYNGKDMGLPYWVILDNHAGLLFDSRFKETAADGKERNAIIGCPATQSEVDKFIEILKKTTPLTDPQLTIIAKRFRQNEK